MYAIAGYVYDENNVKATSVKMEAYFIKRKSSSSPSVKKTNSIYTNVSGYYSINLSDLDFLTTNGKYDTVDEVLMSVEIGDYYCRIVHVIDVSNEYNTQNFKLTLNKNPTMNFNMSTDSIVGSSVTIGGSSYKDEAAYPVTVDGKTFNESQKRTYDAFTIFPKNQIVSTMVDWGDGNYVASMSKLFSTSGNYTINVKSTDGYGYFSIQTFSLQQKYKVVTDHTCDTATIYNQSCKFTSVNTGHLTRIVKTYWYCDNVKIGEGDVINYAFLTPGTHNIKNVVYYNDGFIETTTEKTKSYTINTYSLTTSNTCNTANIYNTSVRFNSTNIGNATIINKTEWFSDGIKIGEGSFADYTFLTSGNHVIKNIVYYSDGFVERTCFAENTYTVKTYYLTTDNVCDTGAIYNKSVNFTSVSTGNATIINDIEWFNDGLSIGHGSPVAYKFLTPGTHYIKNVVKYNDGFVEKQCEKTKSYYVWSLDLSATLSHSPASPFKNPIQFSAVYAITGVPDILKLEPIDISLTYVYTDSKNVNLNTDYTYSYYGTFGATLYYSFWDGWVYTTKTATDTVVVRKVSPIAYDFNWTPTNPTTQNVVTMNFYNRDARATAYSFSGATPFNGDKLSDLNFKFRSTSSIKLDISFFDDWDTQYLSVVKTITLANIPPVSGTDINTSTKTVGVVHFKPTAYDLDGYITEWNWKICDSTGMSILYETTNTDNSDVYWYCETSGNYIVVLKVRDNNGAYDQKEIVFTVDIDNSGGGTGTETMVYVPYESFIANYLEEDYIATLEVDPEDISVELSEDTLMAILT